MNIEFVRLADRWVGTLGCRLFSMVERVRRFLPMSRRAGPPRRFLVIEISEMGSVILAYSMLRELKRRYPESRIHFLMFEKIRESLDLLGLVAPEDVVTLDDRNLVAFTTSALRAIWRIRRWHIDTVLDMELFARISALFSYLSGAARRVGFDRYRMEGLYRGTFLTHRVQYNPYLHIGKNQMALLDALQARPGSSPLPKQDYSDLELQVPRLQNTPEASRRIWEKLRESCPALEDRDRLVLLNPGGGELPIRAWPLENYLVLARALLEQPGIAVGIIGLPSDRRWYRELAAHLPSEHFFDFTGRTACVAELVELFNCADVLVTSDGGPAHFAGLTSIHCIAFFGPETPQLYGPLGKNSTVLYAGLSCSPCLSAYNHRNSPCDGDNVCLKGFSPEEVERLVLDRLRERGWRAR